MKTLGRVAPALLSLLLALPAARAAAKPEELVGSIRTSDRPAPRETDVLRMEGVDYLDIQEMARLFHATKYWRAEIGKMVFKIDSKRITITVGSPYVFVDQQGVNLLAPVLWHEGRIFVPVRLATHVLDPLVPERASWSPEKRELRLLLGEPNILGLSWDLRENGTLVQLRLGAALDGSLERVASNRLVVRIPGGRLADTFPLGSPGVGLVDSVEVAEEADGVVLTFRLGPSAGPAELVARPAPPRLELSVRDAAPDGDLPPAAFDSVAAFPAPREVRIVVLDPGHGGADPGVRGSSLVEKDVNLTLAKKVRDELQALGFEVHLTREDDRSLAPDARARIANARHADVFLSIHANAWFDDRREGFLIGVLPAPGASAPDPAELPRWGERDENTSRESAALADILADRLDATLDRPSRGVHEDRFAPLAGATMPAVLLEVGYLTNAGDAKALADAKQQDRLAETIAESVRAFRDALAGSGATGDPVPEEREESAEGAEI